MLILFDQGTPLPPFLVGHTVKTAAQQGWSTLANGDLLRAAEAAGFDVLLTTDKNLAYQQSLKDRSIAIVVLGNPQWPVARLHIQSIVDAVDAVTPGSYVMVEILGGSPRVAPREPRQHLCHRVPIRARFWLLHHP
jgi:hypothetical protein